MQAQSLQITRFPRLFAVVLFAIAAAMVLGGALGYTLKTATSGSGSSVSHASAQQQAAPAGLADRHGSAGAGSSDTTPNNNSAPRIASHQPY